MTDVSVRFELSGLEPLFGVEPCLCGSTPELGEFDPLYAAAMSYDESRNVFVAWIRFLEEDYPVRYRYFLRKQVWQRASVWQVQWEGGLQPPYQHHDDKGNVEEEPNGTVAATGKRSPPQPSSPLRGGWARRILPSPSSGPASTSSTLKGDRLQQLVEGARSLTLPQMKKPFVQHDEWKPPPTDVWIELPRGVPMPRQLRTRMAERERIRRKRANGASSEALLAVGLREAEQHRIRQLRLAGDEHEAELADVLEARQRERELLTTKTSKTSSASTSKRKALGRSCRTQ
ncbi:hypothetical protein CCYA_CCYA05G1466 [Cyanidiococcus yangmingshanensis]|nr:hypothetical protein CCYA_CCYA05G1466 [Cyanidiococcus yangmingshanensis]